MDEPWWDRPVCFVCDYGWALLLALVLALAAFFTRAYWLPLLGFEPPVEPPPGLGTGDIQATLLWNSTNDIDLWVYDPAGEAIYFEHPAALSGGILDVDANADCQDLVSNPVENIFWPAGGAPPGEYRVEVMYYRQCQADAPTAYVVRLLVDGKASEHRGELRSVGERQLIRAFNR